MAMDATEATPAGLLDAIRVAFVSLLNLLGDAMATIIIRKIFASTAIVARFPAP
tara:strand:- start:90 stop:251 length:162 start_codon:yes stop_codon:yes gene_type:complete